MPIVLYGLCCVTAGVYFYQQRSYIMQPRNETRRNIKSTPVRWHVRGPVPGKQHPNGSGWLNYRSEHRDVPERDRAPINEMCSLFSSRKGMCHWVRVSAPSNVWDGTTLRVRLLANSGRTQKEVTTLGEMGADNVNISTSSVQRRTVWGLGRTEKKEKSAIDDECHQLWGWVSLWRKD